MPQAKVSEDYQVTIPEEILQEVPLTPGQGVSVMARAGVITLVPESSPQTPDFWERRTAAEHAAAQGVSPVESLDAICGGWPEDELDDGFEIAVRQWRDAELRSRP